MKTRSLPFWMFAMATFSLWGSNQAQAKNPNVDLEEFPSGGHDHLSETDWEELPAWLTERRIIGRNNLEPIIATQDTESNSPARSVARVETLDGKGFCTASRISKDIFLTNFHCFEFVGCDELQFHLGYEKNLPESKQLIFTCKNVLAKNERFDYAVYRAEFSTKKPGPEELDFNSLMPTNFDGNTASLADYPIATLWGGPLTVDEPLLVASHPRARLKEVDQSSDCKLRSVEPEEFLGRETITHTCDTEGGSSGSPVFDRKSGYIIALHWGGTEDYNMAVPVSLILEDWKKTLPAQVLSELHIAR